MVSTGYRNNQLGQISEYYPLGLIYLKLRFEVKVSNSKPEDRNINYLIPKIHASLTVVGLPQETHNWEDSPGALYLK